MGDAGRIAYLRDQTRLRAALKGSDMPKIHEMLKSSFLKKEDVGNGVLLTIETVEQQNVAKEGAPEELKWCLTFTDAEKPLVLNSTNIQLCKNIFGSDDTDDWLGKQIVLYTDPNVSYAGKLIGGIRVRAPKPKPQAVKQAVGQKPKLAPVELDESDIPFVWILPLIPTFLALVGASLT